MKETHRATIHVATSGDDTAAGTEAAPLRTTDQAAQRATASTTARSARGWTGRRRALASPATSSTTTSGTCSSRSATPFHRPHSTQVAGYGVIEGGDDRWIGNVFLAGARGRDGSEATFDVDLLGVRKDAAGRYPAGPLAVLPAGEARTRVWPPA